MNWRALMERCLKANTLAYSSFRWFDISPRRAEWKFSGIYEINMEIRKSTLKKVLVTAIDDKEGEKKEGIGPEGISVIPSDVLVENSMMDKELRIEK